MKNKVKNLLIVVTVLLAAFGCSKEDEKSIDLYVTTNSIDKLTAFTAKSGGSISGTEPISERGICWDTSEEPTVDDNVLADVDPVEGEFVLKMNGLEPGTNYGIRAYAVTVSGDVVYGNTVSFSTKTVEALAESNSYLTETDGVLVIPVARANKSALGQQISDGDNITAELIWMDNVDVIEEVATYGNGTSGNVVVVTGNISGNAVVAVKVNNIIVWSWHIWVDEDPASIGTVKMPSGAVLMDRNIGATTKVISEIGAVGVQFQFGRKDPFSASAAYGTPSEVLLYDLNGGNPVIEAVDGPKNLAFVAENPLSFVKSQWVDWCDQDIRTWWQNESGTKTVYDPCPIGWRVPAIEDYAGLADEHFDTTVDGGHNFIYDDQSNFFAYTGYREVLGQMDATANYGTFWVNAAITGDAGVGAAFSPSYGVGGTAAINGAPRARALSIRCIKE